jgi:signal transduction histidine kinase
LTEYKRFLVNYKNNAINFTEERVMPTFITSTESISHDGNQMPLPRPKILVVDDKEENLFAMEQLLETVDVEIVTADSGNEALLLAMKHDLALILLDVQMPDIDGFEVAELLRENKRNKNVPIIFATAFGKEDQQIFKGYHSGAVDYLFKPIDENILLSKINVFLELYNQRQKLERRQADLEFQVQERTEFLHEANRKLKIEIEERKAIQEESLKAKDEAENANNAKSEFLDRMSHELRTPMNSILGFSQVVMQSCKDKLSEQDLENLGFIHKGGERLMMLIDELLDYSKIYSGDLKLDIKKTNLASIMECSIYSTRDLAEKKEVNVLYSKTSAEGCLVEVDFRRVQQMITNLISNAIKFNNPKGSVGVSVENLDDHYVRLGVRDTGIGILEEDKGMLFKPFERLKADKEAIEGIGIGLAFSKRLIEIMNGNIGFESVYGEGSFFFIDLPKSKV